MNPDKNHLELLDNYQYGLLSFEDNAGAPFSSQIKFEMENTHLRIRENRFGKEPTVKSKVNILVNISSSNRIASKDRYFRVFGIYKTGMEIEITHVEHNLMEDDTYRNIAQSLPHGQQSISEYNKTLAYQVLESNSHGIVTSTYSNKVIAHPIRYKIIGKNQLQFEIQSEKFHSQIRFNPQIELLIQGNNKEQITTFVYSGFVTDAVDQISLVLTDFTYGEQSDFEYYRLSENPRNISKQLLISIKLWFVFWFSAMRGGVLLASFFPVLIGAGYAFYQLNEIKYDLLVLTVLGLIFIQGGANLINDYFDNKRGSDTISTLSSPFYSGSRFIRRGLATPNKMLGVGILQIMIGGIIGLFLNTLYKGNYILLLGLVGVTLAYFYTGAPLRLGQRGVGDIVLFITFGPLPIVGSYYVQTGEFMDEVLLISIPLGLVIVIISLLSDLKSYEIDEFSNKRTLALILGKKTTWMLIRILGFAISVTFLLLSFSNHYPSTLILTGLMSLLFLYPIRKSSNVIKKAELDQSLLQIFYLYGLISSVLFILLIL